MSLAGCDSIGDGSTIQSMRLVLAPVGILDQGALIAADEANNQPEKLRMYDCFCSNLLALGTFTNGVLANVNFRARWTSSNPSVVRVLNPGETDTTACPLTQQGPGLLVPGGTPGTATITVEFVGLSDTIQVEVIDTATNPGAAAFVLAPADEDNAGAVAVDATLQMLATGTLDGRPRNLTGNVLTWSFDDVDGVTEDDIATISTFGTITGVGQDNGDALTARATFGACSDIQLTATPIRVGAIDSMALSHEATFTDELLALNTSENYQAIATLDFGDGTFGEQDLSDQIAMTFTDACTRRSTETGCADTPDPACSPTLPICPTDANSCGTHAECRVEAPGFATTGSNRVVATAANTSLATFTAAFPRSRGTPTTLVQTVAADATTLVVAALINYPLETPWEGVIDADGAAEIVRVTAVSGTTLTVERTSPVAHSSGVSFEQRKFESSTQTSTAVTGTLTTVEIGVAPATLPTYDSTQLEATGGFVDVTRTQPVTRLLTSIVGQPSLFWSTTQPAIASVTSTSGILTSNSPCGGIVGVRARASSSTSTTSAVYVAPSDTEPDADDNGNADSNDAACASTDPAVDDPLCDQVNVCITRADPLPPGTVCEDETGPVCPAP